VIEENIIALRDTSYPYKENIIVLLATEARAPDGARHAERIIREYNGQGIEIANIIHPSDTL
jgi:hypothetical protein